MLLTLLYRHLRKFKLSRRAIFETILTINIIICSEIPIKLQKSILRNVDIFMLYLGPDAFLDKMDVRFVISGPENTQRLIFKKIEIF